MKNVKPVFQSALYAVIRKGHTYAVVLASNWDKVQYTGPKGFAIEWATENS